jgi:hypothetical protein
MNCVMGRRGRRSETTIREDQIGRDDATNIAPAGSARINCGVNVVPSYGRSDGKLFRILERETGLESV